MNNCIFVHCTIVILVVALRKLLTFNSHLRAPCRNETQGI